MRTRPGRQSITVRVEFNVTLVIRQNSFLKIPRFEALIYNGTIMLNWILTLCPSG